MGVIQETMQSAYNSLSDSFVLKGALSVLATLAIWLLGLKHVQVLGVFVLFVFMDLFTRWYAIAYQMLIDMGAKSENLSTSDVFIAIPTAWGKGLISSKHMRKPFCNKVFTYVAATGAAWCFDFMAQPYAFAVTLVWTYLGAVEFTSIMENMRDGGNATMSKLLDLFNEKVDAILKRK